MPTVRAWELPQKGHVTSLTRDSASTLPHLSLLPLFSPHQQRLFIFSLLPHDCSPFLTGAPGPFSLTNVSTGSPLFSNPRAWRPCHPVRHSFSFSFSPLTAPFPHRCIGTLSFSNAGGLTFSWICTCHVFPFVNARRDITEPAHSSFLFLFFFSFADLCTSLLLAPPTPRLCHVAFVTHYPFVTRRLFVTPRLRHVSRCLCLAPRHRLAFIAHRIVTSPPRHASPGRVVPCVAPQHVRHDDAAASSFVFFFFSFADLPLARTSFLLAPPTPRLCRAVVSPSSHLASPLASLLRVASPCHVSHRRVAPLSRVA